MRYTSSTIMLVSFLTLVSMLGGARAQCEGCAPLCCDGFGCVSCFTPTPPTPPRPPTPSPPPPSPSPPPPSPPPPSPPPPSPSPPPPSPPPPSPSPPPPSPPPPSPSPPPPSPSPPPPSPSPPPPPQGQYQCGWQAGGTLCPGGLCCSNWGFCGTTEPFCSPASCQSNCTMPSPSPPSPPPPPTPTPEYQCGTQAGGRLCPGGLCCSNWGFCGTTDAYCSPQNCQSSCSQYYDPFVVPNLPSAAKANAAA